MQDTDNSEGRSVCGSSQVSQVSSFYRGNASLGALLPPLLLRPSHALHAEEEVTWRNLQGAKHQQRAGYLRFFFFFLAVRRFSEVDESGKDLEVEGGELYFLV